MTYPELPRNSLPHVTYIAYRKPRDRSWSLDRWLDHWSVIIVHEGSISCKIDENTYTVNAGEVFLFAPGVWRKAWVNSDKFIISAVDFSAPHSVSECKTAIFRPLKLDQLNTVLNRMNYVYVSQADGYQMELDGLLLLFLHYLFHRSEVKAAHPAVEKMKQYIIEYYMRPITAKDLSALVRLDSAYCGKLFKAEQNCTIPQYINKVRVQVACELLDQSGYSLDEIASMCGFCDKFHLGKNFKAIMGVSPKYYARLRALERRQQS